MKISQDVRDFAAKEGLRDNDAFEKGMEEKSKQFLEEGAQLYK